MEEAIFWACIIHVAKNSIKFEDIARVTSSLRDCDVNGILAFVNISCEMTLWVEILHYTQHNFLSDKTHVKLCNIYCATAKTHQSFLQKRKPTWLLLIIWTLGVLKIHYDSVNRFIINLWEAFLNDRLNSDRPTPLLLGGNFLLFAADAHCCFVPTRPDKRWIVHLPLTNIFLKASRFSGNLLAF